LDFKLALSFVGNSHNEGGEGSNNHTDDTSPDYCEDRNYEKPDRGRRGLHGITPYGKRMVRAAAAILKYDRLRPENPHESVTASKESVCQLGLIDNNSCFIRNRKIWVYRIGGEAYSTANRLLNYVVIII
jgi:hypothetical protein